MALSTLMAFQKEGVFVVIQNASIDSRPHYRFVEFRPSTLIRYVLRFRFDPLLRPFSSRCVFDGKAQCISEDGRS